MRMDERQEIGKLSFEGRNFHDNGYLHDAVECYKKAYDLSRHVKPPDDSLERTCAFNLGAVYIARGDITRGLDFLSKARPTEGQCDSESNGDLWFNFALGYEKFFEKTNSTDNLKKALEHYKKAAVEYERANNVDLEKFCLEKQLVILQKFKKYDDCVSVCAKLLHLSRNKVKKAEILAEQASFYRLSQNTEKAEELATEAQNELENWCQSSLDEDESEPEDHFTAGIDRGS